MNRSRRISPHHYDVIERDGCDPVSLELYRRCVLPRDEQPPWWRVVLSGAYAFALLALMPVGLAIALCAVAGYFLSR